MIATLYRSWTGGTKEFCKAETHFGWSTIEAFYRSDLSRAQQGISIRSDFFKWKRNYRKNQVSFIHCYTLTSLISDPSRNTKYLGASLVVHACTPDFM